MELWILDENFILVEVISQYESLTWTKRWLETGEFQLIVSDKYKEIAASVHNPLKIRYVFRSDSDYTGRIDNLVYEDGKIIASGRFLEGLLAFRAETFRMTYNGNVESVMRNIVNQNCIVNKPIPRLILGSNANKGEVIGVTLFGKQISDYLFESAVIYGNSYNIRYDRDSAKLIFTVLWGKNRTQEQTVNDWCLFGHQWSNIYNDLYETNTNYANYATVYGEGEDTARISEIVDIRKSGEELREISVDARDLRQENLSLAAYKKTLYDRGLKKLSEQGKFENITADVMVLPNMPYNLGDTVAIKHEQTGVLFYLPITEEKETFEGGKIEKHISFGDRQNGVMTAIKNR